MSANIEQVIRNTIAQVALIAGCDVIDDFTDDSVLLESGLDSLGFAMLVAQLEEELGYDPFTQMEIAVYPRTFSEFVEFYQQYSSSTGE